LDGCSPCNPLLKEIKMATPYGDSNLILETGMDAGTANAEGWGVVLTQAHNHRTYWCGSVIKYRVSPTGGLQRDYFGEVFTSLKEAITYFTHLREANGFPAEKREAQLARIA
jgi:hypothetical protein